MYKIIFAAAALAAASSMTGTASAASAISLDGLNRAQAASPAATVQNVHWERRGHRRVWVPDYRRRPYHR